MPAKILRFSGPVNWVTGPGLGGSTLFGKVVAADGIATAAQLSLNGIETPQPPQILHDVTFEALTAQDMLLRSGTREWPLRGKGWQLHYDVGATFFAAIPPRPMPWARRLAWRVLLGVAAFGPGVWLLERVGRSK